MTETAIDLAHAAMDTDDAGRLQFYERVADAELFLLLAAEPEGDQITPEVFEVEDGAFVLVFDREDRLTSFVGGPAPYAALSGRAIAGMLAGQGIGLGLNLEVAPSSVLIPESAMNWLHDTLGNRPAQIEAQPIEVNVPSGLPQDLLTALDTKLAQTGGLARAAYLVSVIYAPNRPGHLLAFVDVARGAETALADAVGEALTFSGLDAGELDVGFFASSEPMVARLAKVGLQFELPEPIAMPSQPGAPGMDPEKPPKLR